MTNLPAPRRTIDRRIVGTPEQVRRTVHLAAASGRLVHVSPWRETPEGLQQVTVRLIERQSAPPATAVARRRRRRWPAAAAAGVGATALGIAGYALVQLVDAIIALLPALAGGLLLLALVALITRGRSSRTFTFTGTGRMD